MCVDGEDMRDWKKLFVAVLHQIFPVMMIYSLFVTVFRMDFVARNEAIFRNCLNK
jgi:hypothetical protein